MEDPQLQKMGDRIDSGSRGSKGKESACKARDPGLIPTGRNGNPVQYSCLENPINKGALDRGAWRAIVHGVPRDGHDLGTKQ